MDTQLNSNIRLQLMDTFAIYIGEQMKSEVAQKSPKGASVVQILIANHGKPVPNYQLISMLWDDDRSTNPENALKTLISRMRVIMNEIYPGFGSCIVSNRGSYSWENLPGMTIDYYEVENTLDQVKKLRDDTEEDTVLNVYRKLLSLYKGDFLQNSDNNEWAITLATGLHNRYMEAAYRYIEWLKQRGKFEEIITAARTILEVDAFDDHIQMELMSALISLNRTNDAMVQYKHAMQMNYRYLGVQPSEDMLEFYKKITAAGHSLDTSLETIRRDLRENGEQKSAFYCEYVVFKEIYNMQVRNLERLGSTMFLGLIMISSESGEPMDSIHQDGIMQGLIEILRNNLRKGDTITQFSPNVVAMLLPTVKFNTGDMIMERVKNIFYKRYPSSNVTFTYRVGPLGSDQM